MIELETAKILRENLSECYKREGVNHYEACKEYAEACVPHGAALALRLIPLRGAQVPRCHSLHAVPQGRHLRRRRVGRRHLRRRRVGRRAGCMCVCTPTTRCPGG